MHNAGSSLNGLDGSSPPTMTAEGRMTSNMGTPARHSHDSAESTLRGDGTEESGDASGRHPKSFDTEMGGVDEGFERKSYRHNPRLWSRWFGMPVRDGAKRYLKDEQEEEEDGLLLEADVARPGKTRHGKRKQSLNFRIYCGTIGSSIISVLLIVNIFIGVAFLFVPPGGYDPFINWGKPGTSTEGLAWYPTDFLRDVIPIPCHSHNDYWRKVPLFSALYTGCIGVEADVWHFGDMLYVGHNTAALTANRTFQSLYINPLVEILERQNPKTEFYNGSLHGVFDTDPEQSLTLLVDVKTNGFDTWPVVLEQLEPLRERGWLSFVENDVIHRRPITVVGTGGAPFDLLTANATYRDAFYDAPLNLMNQDQEAAARVKKSSFLDALSFTRPRDSPQGKTGTSPTDDYNPLNSFYASVSFRSSVGPVWWRLNSDQIQLIRSQIQGAHQRGLKARFWDQPSWPKSLRNHVWDVLIKEQIDLLNVDDLEGVKGVW